MISADRAVLDRVPTHQTNWPGPTAAVDRRFGSIESAWNASGRLNCGPCWMNIRLDSLIAVRRTFDPAAEIERIERLRISVTTLDTPDLSVAAPAEVPTPPAIIYYKGTLIEGDVQAVGMVGTRHCTPYGRQMAFTMAGNLAAAGVTVVSGLALGVEARRHRGALDGGGRTIAVLGSGVDIDLPAQSHRELCRDGSSKWRDPLRLSAGNQARCTQLSGPESHHRRI